MDNLIVKDVEFNGDLVRAVQNKETKKIYVGVKWVCEGIGLSEDRTKYERQKMATDLVLTKGRQNFPLLTNGGKQEVLCLELNFLPLWLAKISITPKMQQEKPELTERLVEYQLKAKDVLSEAFIHKPKCLEDIMIYQLEEMKNIKAKVWEVESKVDSIKEVVALSSTQWRKDSANLINKIALSCGGI